MVTRTNVADSIEERTGRGRICRAVLGSQKSVYLTLTRENPNHHYLSILKPTSFSRQEDDAWVGEPRGYQSTSGR